MSNLIDTLSELASLSPEDLQALYDGLAIALKGSGDAPITCEFIGRIYPMVEYSAKKRGIGLTSAIPAIIDVSDIPRIVTAEIRPAIVCLCGSTRFSAAFREANLRETLAGRIVLSIGCDMRSDAEIFADTSPEALESIKRDLDALHLRKIDLADEVLILNVGGYIGESTRRELEYAQNAGKRVRFLETAALGTDTAANGGAE